jgi:hypothetical protein
MSRIFISYRREDTGMGVGRLADVLRQHFAREQVFQDISSIDPGTDFVEALQKALADCAAVLVVIGQKWLTVSDRQGMRRLDNPHDWVRQEIVEALGRPGLKSFRCWSMAPRCPRRRTCPSRSSRWRAARPTN